MARKQEFDLPISDGDRKMLYARFHGLRNKANKKGVPFAWDSFQEFAMAALEKAPPGLSPAAFRMEFDRRELTPTGLGYCEQTMNVNPIKRQALEVQVAQRLREIQGPLAPALAPELVAMLAFELMRPLEGQMREMDEIWEEATILLGA